MSYYPNINDVDFNEKLIAHKEFNELINSNKFSNKDKYEVLLNKIVINNIIPMNYQFFISRFISNYTPYNYLLINHYPGSGKTFSIVLLILSNKEFIVNNNSLIYIVVSNILLKNQWMQILNSYLPDMLIYIRLVSYKYIYNRTINKNERYIKEHINNFNNSIVVIEEAHNATNNLFIEMIEYIKQSSKNLKLILLTATIIKNKINELTDFANFLREPNIPLYKVSDFFKLLDNGEYIITNENLLKKSLSGRVSVLKESSNLFTAPYTYVGKLVHGLEYIKVIEVPCNKFQDSVITSINKLIKDPLGSFHDSISNIVIPFFKHNKKDIFIYPGNRAILNIEEELQNNEDEYNLKLYNFIKRTIKTTDGLNIPKTILSYNIKYKTIEGYFFNRNVIKLFSSKYFFIINLIEKLKGLILIYSNYVKVGIYMIREVLISNGYEDYEHPERGNQKLKKCNICGLINNDHEYQTHDFEPIRFYLLTSTLESTKVLNIINSSENMNGKIIKILLGSKTINEGTSFKNIRHLIKVDSVYTIAREEQIKKRGIRLNSHIDFLIKTGSFPIVYIYNISLKSTELSKEIINYKLAEKKYRSIKQAYDLIEEVSIDYHVYDNNYESNIKKINYSTEHLLIKNRDVKEIIFLINSFIEKETTINFDTLLNILKKEYDEVSIVLAIKSLIKNERVILINIDNKSNDNKTKLFLIKRTTKKDFINFDFLNLNTFIKNNKLIIETNIEDNIVVDNKKEVELEYDLSNISNDFKFIRGVLSKEFKLQFSNELIDLLNLDILKKKDNSVVKDQNNILKGWICSRSIKKSDIKKLLIFFNLSETQITTQNCKTIYNYFFDLEKYNDKNIQYLIYPLNGELEHPLNVYQKLRLIKLKFERKFTILEEETIKLNETIKSFDGYEYDKIKIKLKIKNNETEEISEYNIL